MPINPYKKVTFLKSVANMRQLPSDQGLEVAFVGRSNSGKSSALNCLTGIKNLAYTSKTPGRTQLLNFFSLDDSRRLVDLPGYGYATAPQKIKETWQRNIVCYLEKRLCLQGLVLLMDCRHPMKELDQVMINWCFKRQLPVHIMLTKIDKINRSTIKNTLLQISNHYQLMGDNISVQSFSALKKEGIEDLINHLNKWLQF